MIHGCDLGYYTNPLYCRKWREPHPDPENSYCEEVRAGRQNTECFCSRYGVNDGTFVRWCQPCLDLYHFCFGHHCGYLPTSVPVSSGVSGPTGCGPHDYMSEVRRFLARRSR